ncbi:hypothetical protein A2276_03945 [candidate division WOR-1 bacterium RIFOXYA12_FULL_43_27]|uniref:Uncharacterized protein n=1 Tax=candidate division WOR-1 bacterium RIFOXYC2_FULL_46_14 TaxID=1802587 RepID=A0A1F4U706_UNCSA|nr:MAG: hypothetical protein A2276_03945 [candidate division WOR-1 bacterium RIFOXYA12_FULL_43_27]OGC19156.1 MAG: hypothetical protein A2292_00390 [candidate division WOR-1 bacterium RIFOXYB2_FULL_46_45]OGC30144.1 MAG: hypothetical protein A2232_00390 [candidate division WOR-1 bacterium RIFOXYA2_FULL_46_56]OGC40746.1 MAG: hypothetical protein A2438_00395 [candidate division WOR-1 bacterium RIFOXYC2_FULL_46_14]
MTIHPRFLKGFQEFKKVSGFGEALPYVKARLGENNFKACERQLSLGRVIPFEFRGQGEAFLFLSCLVLDDGQINPSILNAAIRACDFLNDPSSSQRPDWYSGQRTAIFKLDAPFSAPGHSFDGLAAKGVCDRAIDSTITMPASGMPYNGIGIPSTNRAIEDGRIVWKKTAPSRQGFLSIDNAIVEWYSFLLNRAIGSFPLSIGFIVVPVLGSGGLAQGASLYLLDHIGARRRLSWVEHKDQREILAKWATKQWLYSLIEGRIGYIFADALKTIYALGFHHGMPIADQASVAVNPISGEAYPNTFILHDLETLDYIQDLPSDLQIEILLFDFMTALEGLFNVNPVIAAMFYDGFCGRERVEACLKQMGFLGTADTLARTPQFFENLFDRFKYNLTGRDEYLNVVLLPVLEAVQEARLIFALDGLNLEPTRNRIGRHIISTDMDVRAYSLNELCPQI